MLKFNLTICLFVSLILIIMPACGGDNEEKVTEPTGTDPSVGSISPDSGNVGTMVEITGSDFESGAVVYFGKYQAISTEFVSSSTLVAFASDSLKPGILYEVKVKNPGGAEDSYSGNYRAVPPNLIVMNGVSRPSGNTESTAILEGRAFGDLLSRGKVFFSDASGQPIEATVSLEDNWTNEFILTTVPSGTETGPVWIETPTGASDSIIFTITSSPSFSPSVINWTETTPLPEPSQGHGANFIEIESGPGAGSIIYVTGGADSSATPRSGVISSEIDELGQLLSWNSEADMPEERAFHGSAIATPFNAFIDTLNAGFLYVAGGIDSSGAPRNTVFVSAINKDRSIGGWGYTSTLPIDLHSMGAVIFRSWLYIAGGATSGDEPENLVYRAKINYDGSLGLWEPQPPLPSAVSYATLITQAGVLYVVGGESTARDPGSNTITGTSSDQLLYNTLDLRTGELKNTTWSINPNNLIKSASKHSALVAGGWIFVSGGLYNGASTSSTEHQYASINIDGTVEAFSGATGSQTIVNGAGGDPFYNHAAVVYTDAEGNAHVVIIGGNRVTDSTDPIAKNYIY